MFEYHAKLVEVVDGDTVHVDLDLGVDEHRMMTLRLYGLDAPEKLGATKVAGVMARNYVVAWFAEWCPPQVVGRTPAGDPILASVAFVRTFKNRTEKYGRYLADVYSLDESHWLNRDLIDSGNAVPYMV